MSKYTREDILALKLKDPSELTPEERRLVNLNPTKDGQVLNPNGRKKGVKNWSTMFQKLMGDPDFLKTIIKKVPGQWEGIVGDIPADVIAAGMIATVTKGVAEAVVKDKPLPKDVRDSISLLNKLGYGDKIVHEDADGIFEKTNMTFMVVPSHKRDEEDSEDAE